MSSVSASSNQTLRSYPVFTECCGGAPTSVENSYNCVNLITCVLCNPCWFVHQACKTKDMNCYDARHSCTTCGKVRGEYSACN